MKIMGIDPGTAIVGYGILENSKYLAHGVITTLPNEEDVRLLDIYVQVNELLEKYKPDHLAIENLFFNKNAKTAISVSQARGVIILAAAQRGIPVKSYTPLQVKQGVTAYGRADKEAVQFMVAQLLELDEIPKPDDAADALAIALTHLSYLDNFREYE